MVGFAESIISKCDPTPFYARVDIIIDNNNELALSELELIEPELWFRFCPESAHLLAKEVTKGLLIGSFVFSLYIISKGFINKLYTPCGWVISSKIPVTCIIRARKMKVFYSLKDNF